MIGIDRIPRSFTERSELCSELERKWLTPSKYGAVAVGALEALAAAIAAVYVCRREASRFGEVWLPEIAVEGMPTE